MTTTRSKMAREEELLISDQATHTHSATLAPQSQPANEATTMQTGHSSTTPTQPDLATVLAQMAQLQVETYQQMQQAEYRRQAAAEAREVRHAEEQTRKTNEKEEHDRELARQQQEDLRRQEAMNEAAQKKEQEQEDRFMMMMNHNSTILTKTLENYESNRAADREHADTLRRETQRQEDERDGRHIQRHFPTIAKIQHPENMEAFLTTFEEAMTIHHIPTEYWVTQLIQALDDRSAQFVRQVEGPDKYNFAATKERLLKFHSINSSHYRKRWETMTFPPNETAQQLAQKASLLWNAWSKQAVTRADMADMIIREKVIAHLPPTTQEWVKQRNPKTIAEAAELADDHLGSRSTPDTSNRQPPQYPRRDGPRPGPPQYPRRDRQRQGFPRSPGNQFHNNLHNPQPGGLLPTPPNQNPIKNEFQLTKTRPIECYTCKQPGHIVVNCPSKAQCNVAVARLISVPYPERDLDIYTGQVDGNIANTMLIDSGCTFSQVHAKMIDPEFSRTGTVNIDMASGDQRLDTTIVTIDLEGKRFRKEVAINPASHFHAIMGLDIPGIRGLMDGVPKERWTTQQFLETPQPQPKPPSRPRQCMQRVVYSEWPTSSETEGPQTSSDNEYPTTTHKQKRKKVQRKRRTRATMAHHTSNSEQSDAHKDSTPQASNTSEDNGTKTHSDVACTSTTPTPTKKKRTNRPAKYWGLPVALDGGRAQLISSQQEDDTLKICRKQANTEESQFFYEKEVLKRRWTPPRQAEEVHQIVLPCKYRETVLRLAHSSPLAAHFGKHKITARHLQRFFWPGIREDVADTCS